MPQELKPENLDFIFLGASPNGPESEHQHPGAPPDYRQTFRTSSRLPILLHRLPVGQCSHKALLPSKPCGGEDVERQHQLEHDVMISQVAFVDGRGVVEAEIESNEGDDHF